MPDPSVAVARAVEILAQSMLAQGFSRQGEGDAAGLCARGLAHAYRGLVELAAARFGGAVPADLAPVPDGPAPSADARRRALPALMDAMRALEERASAGLIDAADIGASHERMVGVEAGATINADPAAAGGRVLSLGLKRSAGRRVAGAWYTPLTLVEHMLEEGLEPTIARTLQGPCAKRPDEALLSLRICDPACGSGRFLIAAARRLAARVARVRTGAAEPGSGEVRGALREVVASCVYGVDVDARAVELCRAGLWLACEGGVPVSTLRARVKQGDALGGAPGWAIRGANAGERRASADAWCGPLAGPGGAGGSGGPGAGPFFHWALEFGEVFGAGTGRDA